ncbi:hypothetical protein M3693_18980, partial [Cellulosimicrobium funkei]|nr:hypothetical protein [Cellulosimicrobium funkei]
DIVETYRREGFGPAMAKFVALVSHVGPLPADYLDRPAPTRCHLFGRRGSPARLARSAARGFGRPWRAAVGR